jgi:hypothetical protein
LFIPQTYPWGQEEQVDWYKAWAEVDGEPVKAYAFCLRSMASGETFHQAYPSTPASRPPLEGHERHESTEAPGEGPA